MDDFYKLHTELCRAIFNPKRLIILEALREKEMKVSHLADTVDLTQSNLSHHLSILKSRGVVSIRRERNNIYYSIANPNINKTIDLISDILRQRLENQSDLLKKASKDN